MWRKPKAPPIPIAAAASPEDDGRVITAKYNIANRRDLRSGSRLFFACRVETFDAAQAALSVPVTGAVGEPAHVRIDRFGEIRGFVTKRTRTGFVMSITATDSERAKLQVKIDWFEKNRGKQLIDNRQHDRFAPEDPLSTLIFADGSTLRCFVVDMSSSGAAVSARVIPPAGTPLALGKVVGRVVRHLPNGFAMRFIDPVEVPKLESLLIKSSV